MTPVLWTLEVNPLFKGLDEKRCFWSYDSQGMIYLELKKNPDPFFW